MHRGTVRTILALLPSVAACAGGPGGGTTSPPTLTYQVPDAAPVAYVQADTAVMSIDAGGQMFDVNVVSQAVMDMEFAPVEAGVRVTATWTELDAYVSNPMGAPERISVDDVDGPLVFDLDSRGVASVVSAPTLTGSATQMVSPASVANGFFPRLPGSAPTPGMTWTDTISFEAEEGVGSTVSRSIVTYTVAGDTVVAGTTLLKVDMSGETSETVEGVTSGMAFIQNSSGEVGGHFLWDLTAGMMHSQVTESDLVGTMDVEAAPFPLDVAIRAISRVRLQEN
jgi:hypothetical protein